MFALTGVPRGYAWGSLSAIPEFLGQEPSAEPVAELWFGAHPIAPSPVSGHGLHLGELIAGDPVNILGEQAVGRFGAELPFLFKLLAPAAPLSMQVHPTLAQARDGFARAQAGGAGAPIDYVDSNHKPELLYSLTRFEALSGLRTATEVREVLAGLHHDVIDRALSLLEANDDASGVGSAFAHALTHATPDYVEEIARQCAERAGMGTSPSEHSDQIVARLADEYPGDPGVVASLFLTPRILQPGEVMFVPAGVVHAYLDGLAVEIMANSDNVLRAGLTSKNVDVPELLKVLAPSARAGSLRGEETGPGIIRFPTPVQDFELTAITADGGAVFADTGGPRILLALEAEIEVRVSGSAAPGVSDVTLGRGEAVFVPDSEGPIEVTGGRVLHAGLPTRLRPDGSA